MWWLHSSVYVNKQLKDVLSYLAFVKKFLKKNIYTVYYCVIKFNNNNNNNTNLNLVLLLDMDESTVHIKMQLTEKT